MLTKSLDILIPVRNEAQNIAPLCARVHAAMTHAGITYRLIFIVDPSTDETVETIKGLSSSYPIILHLKQGKPGKAYSLIEGAALAETEYVAMLDGDLQYPPEAIPTMFAETQRHGVVIAKRISHEKNWIRFILSRINLFLFGKILFGAPHDFQSGLKVFRRYLFNHLDTRIIRPWSFDIPLLHTALDLGHTIGSVPIIFEGRTNGSSKVRVFSAAYQIIRSAVLTKFTSRNIYRLEPEHPETMTGAGVAHKRKVFITHTTLPHYQSALVTFHGWQKLVLPLFVILFVAGLLFAPIQATIAFVALISAIYFVDVMFYLWLVMRSLRKPSLLSFTPAELSSVSDEYLPVYSVLCPLYREARVLPQFLRAMEALEWPKDKLEVLLLLEETDQETIEAARKMNLPPYMKIVIVPDSQPRTKPKACNYGLNVATGEYIVIYDAEDKPDPWQLKKAYLAFQMVPDTVFCLQAKLNYYNPNQNLLTRLFSAEYALWFDLILTGLQSMSAVIPLGGTSNHFRTKNLRLLHGWDPFNVTEDCDLGARLFKEGYTTAILDSLTLEEANSRGWNWIRQRSRWIKGYMQTYLVQMRQPFKLWRDLGPQAFIFQLVVGGKITFMIINPLLWIATICYFSLKATIGPAIEQFYPPYVYYLATFSLVFGNFLYLYYYMIGCAKSNHWSLVKYVFLVPIYWLMISIAAVLAFFQLLYKPHYWEKTHHGLHLEEESSPEEVVSTLSVESTPIKPRRWKSLFAGSTFLVGSMMLVNVINFLFNAFLGRVVTLNQLSVVTLLSSFWNIALLFLGAYAASINHTVAYLSVQGGETESVLFRRKVRNYGLIVIGALAILWFVFIPVITLFFNLHTISVASSVIPILLLGFILYTNVGYFEGRTWFVSVGILYLTEAVSKFLIAALILYFGYEQYTFLAVPLSVTIAALVSWSLLLSHSPSSQPGGNQAVAFPFSFFGASLLAGVSATIFTSLDIILAKHYLSAAVAGQYSLLALFGKIIFFLGSLPSALIITFTSRNAALRSSPLKVFLATFLGTGLLVGAGLVALGPLAPWTVALLVGERGVYVMPYLQSYSVAIAFFTLANTIVLYHVARKHYVLAWISLLQGLLVAATIAVMHESIDQMVSAMRIAGLASFVSIFFLQLITKELRNDIVRALNDLKDLITFRLSFRRQKKGKLRILIFNWRDMRHTLAGGAEKYIQEIASQWTKDGHTVTLFCGNDGLLPRFELIDGVQIVRRGGFYLVYLWAFLYYIFRFRGRYDVVIDCHNGIPFFTPLYVRKKTFLLIHHVHLEVFRHSLSRPLALVAEFLEKTLMPLLYRKIQVITVSESSKKDIEALGMNKRDIEIVHPGVDIRSLKAGKKEEKPLIVYLGRLKKYKSLDVLLHAFKHVLTTIPEARLVIAGDGEELLPLQALVYSLHIQHAITFAGKVTHEEKISLLQRAWVAVNPSFKEGWGITTIEANACGTPVIASDVPGLRDSVQNPYTGYLVPYGDEQALAQKLTVLLQDPELRATMSQKARDWSLQFDHLKASEKFLNIIYG